MNVQKSVRDNSQEIQDSIKELNDWTEEIKKKDQELKLAKTTIRNLPPVRGTVSEIKPETKIIQVAQKPEKPKEDKVKTKEEESEEQKVKGNDFFKKGRYEEAIQCYTRTIQLTPQSAIGYANRGMAYLNMKSYEKAEQDCTSAIALDKQYIKAYSRRGSARKNLGKYEDAINDFQETLTLEPGNKQAIEELAAISRIHQNTKSQKPIIQVQDQTKPPSQPAPQPAKSPKRVVIEEIEEDEKEKQPPPQKVVPPQRKFDNIKAELPKEAPKTTYDFETFWNTVKTDPATFFEYLKMIPVKSFPQVFKNSMRPEIFSSIIPLLELYFLPNVPDQLLDLLKILPQIPRFDMNLMFMSKTEKQALSSLFEQLSQKTTNQQELLALKSKYGL